MYQAVTACKLSKCKLYVRTGPVCLPPIRMNLAWTSYLAERPVCPSALPSWQWYFWVMPQCTNLYELGNHNQTEEYIHKWLQPSLLLFRAVSFTTGCEMLPAVVNCLLVIPFVTPPLGKEELCDQGGETGILHLLWEMNWKKSGISTDR